ncbi:MAG TPA: hypothetical protein VLC95_07475, partial [Anaerolineae bacterium]|nr:hypothetical protein [Anaerolineae bacterium]
MTDERDDRAQSVDAQLDGWARSLAGKTGRVRGSLSPWVQRALASGAHAHGAQAGVEPAGEPAGGGRQRQTALSESGPRALWARIYRKVEGTRAWHPEQGPAAPMAMDRFAADIVQRFAPVSDKYAVESGEASREEESDLVLAPVGYVDMSGGLPAPDSESWMESIPEGSVRPTPFEAAPEAYPAPPPLPPPPPTIQRRPGVRPMSRIEEITPGGKTPALPPVPVDVAAKEATPVPDGYPGSARPAPPPVQRAGQEPVALREVEPPGSKTEAAPPGLAPDEAQGILGSVRADSGSVPTQPVPPPVQRVVGEPASPPEVEGPTSEAEAAQPDMPLRSAPPSVQRAVDEPVSLQEAEQSVPAVEATSLDIASARYPGSSRPAAPPV